MMQKRISQAWEAAKFERGWNNRRFKIPGIAKILGWYICQRASLVWPHVYCRSLVHLNIHIRSWAVTPQALDVISFQIDVAHFSRCKCKWCFEHSSFASVATSYFNMVTFLVPWKTMDIQLAHLCSVWHLFWGQTKKLVFLKTSFFRDGHFKGAIKRAFLPPNYFGPSISLKNIRPNHLPKEFHPLLKTTVCPPPPFPDLGPQQLKERRRSEKGWMIKSKWLFSSFQQNSSDMDQV